MYKQADKHKKNESRAVANIVSRKKYYSGKGFGLTGNGPDAFVQRKPQVIQMEKFFEKDRLKEAFGPPPKALDGTDTPLRLQIARKLATMVSVAPSFLEQIMAMDPRMKRFKPFADKVGNAGAKLGNATDLAIVNYNSHVTTRPGQAVEAGLYTVLNHLEPPAFSMIDFLLSQITGQPPIDNFLRNTSTGAGRMTDWAVGHSNIFRANQTQPFPKFMSMPPERTGGMEIPQWKNHPLNSESASNARLLALNKIMQTLPKHNNEIEKPARESRSGKVMSLEEVTARFAAERERLKK